MRRSSVRSRLAPDAFAKDVAIIHARLGQGLQLKRPVLIRGGDARITEPASHRPKTPCRMSGFSHGLFARQVPCETVVQTARTAPSLVALSACLRNDPMAGAGGTSIRTIPTFIIATATSTRPLDRTDRTKRVRCARLRMRRGRSS